MGVGELGQPLVIEVHVAERPQALGRVDCEEGLARSPRADDDLDQVVVEPGQVNLALDVWLAEALLDFTSLEEKDVSQHWALPRRMRHHDAHKLQLLCIIAHSARQVNGGVWGEYGPQFW